MDNENCFKDLFESIRDYSKIFLLIFLIQNDKNLLKEIGFSKNDISRLNLDFKNILLEQNENYLYYVKNREESIIENFLSKKMEAYFASIFEDVRHERSLILLLSLTDSDIMRQSKLTDDEIDIIKNLALEKIHRQRILKEYHAASFLEKNIFSD